MKLATTLINTNTLLAPNGQMDSDSVFVLLTGVSIYHLKGLNHHQMITCDWGSANFHKQINRNCRQDNIFWYQTLSGFCLGETGCPEIWAVSSRIDKTVQDWSLHVMYCSSFYCIFFNVVHITLYSTVLKRVTLQAKWVQSRTAVMKIDIMNQIGQRSEYHCAVNTADGKAKDLRWMLILSSWLEWQHLLNNPERQKFRRLKDKQWIRQERGIRSPNSPSP